MAAYKVGELFARISLDDKSLGEGLKRAKTNLAEVGQAASQLGGILTAAVTAPMVGLGYAAVKSGMQMDSLMRGLTAVTGSSAEANRQLKDLKEIAKLPGLGMAEAIQGSINLQAAGLSAELAQDALKGFGNALATVGKGKADLEGVQMALSQIMSKGVISAEEINQLAERVPQIRKVMEQAFGTANTEALQKMGIGAEEFVGKVVAELNKLPAVVGGAQNSWENMVDGIQAALVSLWPTIEPIFNAITSAVSRAAEFFTKLPGPVKGFALALGAVAAMAGPALLLTGQLINAWKSVQVLMPLLRVAFSATWKAALGPIGWVIAGVMALAAGATYLYNHWEPAKRFFDGLWSGIKKAFEVIWVVGKWVFLHCTLPGLIIRNWDKIKGFFTGLWDEIKEIFSKAGNWFNKWSFLLPPPAGTVGMVMRSWGKLKPFFGKLWNQITEDAGKSAPTIGPAVALDQIMKKWESSVDAAISGFAEVGKKMREGLKGWADEILDELDRFRDEQKSRYEKLSELGPAGIAAMQPGVHMFAKKKWTPENLPGSDILKRIFAGNEADKANKEMVNFATQKAVFGDVADLPSRLGSIQKRVEGGSIAGSIAGTAAKALELKELVDLAKQQVAELKKLNQPLAQT